MAAVQELLDERFPIVSQLYKDVLGMEPMDVRDRPLQTPAVVYACPAPPLHPFLWQAAQSTVLGLQPPLPLSSRRKLVMCSRRDSSTTEHPGRLLLNEDEMVAMMRAKCAASPACEEVVYFNHKAFHNNVSAIAHFFSDAIALISPHGGCLTNVNLMPCNAGVVEIMPLAGEQWGEPTEPHWHMLYMQAVFLEHRYYMLPVPSAPNTRDDMLVPLEHMGAIVDELLAPPPEGV
jgi:hypothetical protein